MKLPSRRQYLRHAFKMHWNRTVPVTHLADVNVTLHDAQERKVVDIAGTLNSEPWLEQHFHATETLGANSGDVFVRELVGLYL